MFNFVVVEMEKKIKHRQQQQQKQMFYVFYILIVSWGQYCGSDE